MPFSGDAVALGKLRRTAAASDRVKHVDLEDISSLRGHRSISINFVVRFRIQMAQSQVLRRGKVFMAVQASDKIIILASDTYYYLRGTSCSMIHTGTRVSAGLYPNRKYQTTDLNCVTSLTPTNGVAKVRLTARREIFFGRSPRELQASFPFGPSWS